MLILNGVSMAEIVAQNKSQRERLGSPGRLQVGSGRTSQTLASCKFACPSTVGILLTCGSVPARLGMIPNIGKKGNFGLILACLVFSIDSN